MDQGDGERAAGEVVLTRAEADKFRAFLLRQNELIDSMAEVVEGEGGGRFDGRGYGRYVEVLFQQMYITGMRFLLRVVLEDIGRNVVADEKGA